MLSKNGGLEFLDPFLEGSKLFDEQVADEDQTQRCCARDPLPGHDTDMCARRPFASIVRWPIKGSRVRAGTKRMVGRVTASLMTIVGLGRAKILAILLSPAGFGVLSTIDQLTM